MRRTIPLVAPTTVRWLPFVALMFFGVMPRTCEAQTPDAGTPEAPKAGIQHVDLVHFSHTDYGFTDHPAVCRELQKRYLDIAIDAVLATREKPDAGKFCWTAETTIAVNDWWQTATAARREDFLKAVRSGQLEISAFPLNQTPTLNRRQWQKMLHWLPEDLWQEVQPRAALQNDVNGFPRAGAMALLDRGIHYLFSSINPDSGGAPLRRPSAFWWKMPDGRRLFVWLNFSYPHGYYFLEQHSWRRGPVPEATDTRYRPARPGDFFKSDEASVRKAHRLFVRQLRRLVAGGYSYPTLLLSMTNEWRMDNDPPFPPLAEFVAAWNRLELKPTLRLTTVSTALKRMEKEIGDKIPEYQGEWTDWWANGVASGPREVAASRLAKRLVAAAESPLWGELDENGRKAVDQIYEDLCLFDEHTWGSGNSVALPDSLEVLGQYNEKARFAYRPMAMAKLLLSQRVRGRLVGEGEGLYVANTSGLPLSGWITMPASCLRGNYRSVVDPRSGQRVPLEPRNGLRPFSRPQNEGELTPENTAATFPDNCAGQTVRFWVDNLEGGTVRKLQLSTEAAAPPKAPQHITGPTVALDENGWPTLVAWPTMERPLFTAGFGDFVSVGIRGFAPRWIGKDIFSTSDDARRQKLRTEKLAEIPATPAGKATVEKNLHTTVYLQRLQHPRLAWATRRLELWNREPRARLTLRIDRTSSGAPEVFFVVCPLPCEGTLPKTSNGGVPLVPFEDQLPGTCRDYFAIDGWVQYETPDGNWLWVSRDAPLVTFGAPQVLARRTDAPKDVHRVLAMVFNNRWYTNFVGNSHGVMEFQFDLIWKKNMEGPREAERLAESLQVEPQVLIQPGLKESPLTIEHIYRP